MPTHRVELSFSYPSSHRARRVERSISPEAGEVDDDRSTVAVAREGDTVTVSVAAADLTALRASTNTWSRLVGVAEAVGDPPRE